MRFRCLLLSLFCSILACADSNSPSNIDDSQDAGVDGISFRWPEPKFTAADYLKIAQDICANPNPDSTKLVFSSVTASFHVSPYVLFHRNGTQFLHINEACDMWVLQYNIGDNMLERPLYKHIEPEVLAHILEHYRTLELKTFDEAGQTDFSFSLNANWSLFFFKGQTYGFDYEYQPHLLGGHPEDLLPLEVLIASIVRYDPWSDPIVVEGLTPYVGERLWITILAPGVQPPDSLIQPWPLEQGPEEFGPITVYECSNGFPAFTGEQADALRAARKAILSQSAPDSSGHWGVPMMSNGSKYWVLMSESMPMEDELGFVTFRDYRIGFVPCE